MADVTRQGTFQLTVVANPFEPHTSKVIRHIEIPGSLTIASILERLDKIKTDDLCVSLNGRPLSADDMERDIRPGDSLVVMVSVRGGGNGKQAASMIATIVVLAAATAVTAGAAAPMLGAAFASGTFGAAAIGVSIGVGGSYLINSIVARHAQNNAGGLSLSDGIERSNTYGWNPPENQIAEGLPIPVLYGTHRVTPQIIGRYTDTDGDSQYLNLLFAVAEGPLTSITSIQINGNPSTSYQGIATETKLGTNSQTYTGTFSDTVSETAVGSKVTTSGVTATTDGNGVTWLGVGVIFPGGLYRVDTSDGTFQSATVDLVISYRKVGGAWVDMGKTVTAAKQAVLRRFWTIGPPLSAGQYEVKVSRVAPESSETTKVDEVYFEVLQEAITDDFNYPNTALLAVRALATDQLSGSRPVVDCLAVREDVEVYFGSTPWNLKPANNPAWICYDMLVNTRYGAGISTSRIILQDFVNWADWCEDQGITCNIYLDAQVTIPEALARVGAIGRGAVIQRGTSFGAWYDGSASVVQLFTVGNMIEESFSTDYLEKESRANVVAISFLDAAADYEKRTIEVHADGFDAGTDTEQRSEIMLTGCTSYTQAVKHARFLLNCNQYIVRTIEFQADVDAIACQPGDIIAVQHDVPQWGYGGRVVSATASGVVLDRSVPVSLGDTLAIMVRHTATDTLETKTLVNPGAGSYTSFTTSSPWSTVPSLHDLYSAGKSTSYVKQFRVIGVERSQDSYCRISAIEYRSEVYNDALVIPDYESESDLPKVAALRLDDIYRPGDDGVIRAYIAATWRGFAIRWGVYLREHGTTAWRKIGDTTRPEYEVSGLDIGKTYDVAVTSTDNPDDGEQETIAVVIDPPEQVTGLSAQVIDNFVTLRWQEVVSELPATYEIRNGTTWASGQVIGLANKTFTTWFERIAGTYTYWVAGVNTRGEYGTAASVSVAVSVPEDYVAYDSLPLQLDGTVTRMVKDPGPVVVGPLDTSETWQDWFDAQGCSDLQDFIDAGHTLYFQPDGATTGTYVETLDFGAEFDQALVSLDITTAAVLGSTVTIAPTIETSPDNATWTSYAGVWQADASDIRYVRVTLNVASTGGAVTKITSGQVRLVAREIIESGSASVSSAPAGKVVSFTKPFADVRSIVVTPKQTAARTAVYDFTDGPNPTSFTVYLFDSAGNKVTGEFSYTVTGV